MSGSTGAVLQAGEPAGRAVVVFSTGGTIIMRPAPGAEGVQPQPGADLVSPVRGLHSDIALEHVELFAKPSASIALADIQVIADAIVERMEHGFCGAVVTHGTDTLEETAFALSLMLDDKYPVVVTGAMRSPDQLGADGPANLSAAITVAASRQTSGLGPVVLIGDELHAAHMVRKTHSSRPHAFSSGPSGPIGYFIEGRLELAMIPAKRWHADMPLRLGQEVPPVPILEAGLDLEPETISAFSEARIGALVIAGAGGGHVSSRAMDAISDLADKVPVIITSRTGMGHTLSRSYAYGGSEIDLARRGVINGGRWRPAQARLLTQILLSNNASRQVLADRLAG